LVPDAFTINPSSLASCSSLLRPTPLTDTREGPAKATFAPPLINLLIAIAVSGPL